MKIVLQRVSSASVTVDGEICGKIGTGYLVLLGVGQGDTEEDCRRLADKIINLRIFSDENDKINLSLSDVGGDLLIVSQFTLYADCRKGNRPNFIQAGKPDEAERLYNLCWIWQKSCMKNLWWIWQRWVCPWEAAFSVLI